MGTSEATHYGSLLFERLLRAMMVSVCPYGLMSWRGALANSRPQWDTIQMLHAEETVPMIQLALLGQTFGLLSGVCEIFGVVV